MSEIELQSAILEALAWDPNLVAWRNNVGARGRTRYGLAKGAADIIAIVGPGGRFLGLEVKAPGGRLSEQQETWGGQVVMRGGYYAVVTSVAEALAAVKAARENAT